jgi:syntaxin-binding protein 1
MAMLGEYPYIRFQAPIHNQPSGMLPEHLALKIQAALDRLSRNDSSYPPVSLVQRGVLMVLERGVDIVSTLLHEFTYQALIADVLEITDRVKDENGKDNVLDESDVVWVSRLL